MILKAISLSDLEKVREWRNKQISMLRTPFPLTSEQQSEFYKNVICNRQSNGRFWGIYLKDFPTKFSTTEYITPIEFIGMTGIENIQWENRLGEISLLLNPKHSTNENLYKALTQILYKGFMCLNLENIYTEVYECSPFKDFWLNYINTCGINNTVNILPNRKYCIGRYWNSFYINFNKGAYIKNENNIS